ncbi:MAG: nitroreductase family protein [Clostridiales bacterium]|nr:nitroreductase family protein [Clostridiales bacterium]
MEVWLQEQPRGSARFPQAELFVPPTAMNQQKFSLLLRGRKVIAKAGIGFYTKVDHGIIKYHFEVGAGTDNFDWA